MTDDVSGKAGLEALAERYLDLWQDQVTAMAADADFTAAFQNMFGQATGPAAGGASPLAAWQAMMAGMASPQGNPQENSGAERKGNDRSMENDSAATTAGAPAAASAPDGGGPDLDGIARRLAALEARLVRLEGGVGRPGGKAKGSNRRKRS